METARALAAHGAHVVGAARDLTKAEAATAQVRRDAAQNRGSFQLVELDLANLKSVRNCTEELIAKGEPFDLVIANAGVMATPFGHTADGFETQFGTNHLGHFLFVNRIARLMRAGSRLVNVSSSGHRYANVDLDDPNFERTSYGYAEVMIAQASGLAAIPDELLPMEAAPLLCAGLTTFNGLRNSKARPGELVAIQGVGGLGHLGIQFARRMGFQVAAIARGPEKEKPLEEARCASLH